MSSKEYKKELVILSLVFVIFAFFAIQLGLILFSPQNIQNKEDAEKQQYLLDKQWCDNVDTKNYDDTKMCRELEYPEPKDLTQMWCLFLLVALPTSFVASAFVAGSILSWVD